MNIEINGKINFTELNELLSSMGWQVNPIERLEQALELSWSWITAKDGERLVGFVHMLSDGIKHAYILRLIVHKDYQGMGIGTRIVEEMIKLLNENSLNPILLTKPKEESFYNKFGLTRTDNGLIALFQWR